VAAVKSASNTILSGEIAAFGTESICKKRLVIRQSFISYYSPFIFHVPLTLVIVHSKTAWQTQHNSDCWCGRLPFYLPSDA